MTLADARLTTAVANDDPIQVQHALVDGAPPNNLQGEKSHLHNALINWALYASGKRVFNIIALTNTDDEHTQIFAAPDQQIKQKTRSIAFMLMANGARLEHAPENAKPPYSPALDFVIWAQPYIRADAMMGALYCAIKRNEPLPRLNFRDMGATFSKMAGKRNEIYYTLAKVNVMGLCNEISASFKDPKDGISRWVTENLSERDRTNWLHDTSQPRQPRTLKKN